MYQIKFYVSAKGDCQGLIQKHAMNTAFKIIISSLALMACMAALGTLASLLFDATHDARDEFGASGTHLEPGQGTETGCGGPRTGAPLLFCRGSRPSAGLPL